MQMKCIAKARKFPFLRRIFTSVTIISHQLVLNANIHLDTLYESQYD